MTDPRLIDAHLKNDPTAFPTLVARHIDFVHGIAARQCPAHADDITQAVFLLLSQKAHSLQGCPTLHGWLFHTALLCAKNALRADRRRQSHEREAAMQPRPTSSHNPELLPLLDQAIASLPAADRELLLRRHFQNQQLPDIAAHLRISLPAATKRLQRATEKLRTWFTARGHTASQNTLATLFLSAAAHRAPHALSTTIATSPAPASAALARETLTTMARTKFQTAALAAAACVLITIATGAAYIHFHRSPIAPSGIKAPTPIVTPANLAPSPATTLTPVSAPNSTDITITGTVKDSAGNPIDHAFVSQGWSPFAADKSFHSTYTDPDGNFTLTRFKPGDNLLLTATAPGFSPQVFQSGKLLANPAPATFSLPPGHTLKLHFIDERGNPIKNVLAQPISWQNKDVLRSEFEINGSSRAAMKAFTSDASGDITWNSAPADPVEFMYAQHAKNSPYRRDGARLTASDKSITITLKDALKISATVLDAKTRRPIPDFDFYTGEGSNPNSPYGWDSSPHRGENGAFSYIDHEFSEFAFIRIEAPGYPPTVKSVPRDNSPATLTFNLSAADALHLTVLTPDKQPADNVRVYTATAPTHFNFENDTVQEGVSPSDPPFQTTDSDGHVLLTDPGKTPARILVLAPDGYAERLPADLRANPTITLEPWASLALHIHNADTPLAHTLVEILYTIPQSPDAPSITISLRAKTNATGDVSFLRLPPRKLAIAHQLIANENTPFAQYVSIPLQTLTPTPGQSLDLALPDDGHAISGKLVNPDGSPLPTHSYFSVAHMAPPRITLTPEETKELNQLSPDDRNKWLATFAKKHPRRTADPFLINPDGSFHATNIPPGDYTLTVSLLDPTTGKPTLTLSHPLTMPDSPTTLNLGNLPLQKPSPPSH